MEYTQLDSQARLTMVRQRIADLERQYAQLDLRVNAPDLNTPPSEMDNANLNLLEKSLIALHQMETDLSGTNPPASTPS